ncbi:MAG: T9SS type A sorting domain-containing protein, partial [Bacteroidales bacterium]|nr:T9SS type A sorting domain-containing protein [Bacteroidales bacterium]
YEVANNMVGIIQTEKEIKRIKYYPNPVNLMLTIEGVSSSEVEIYDLNGALLGVYKIASNQIDLGSLKPGAYIARVVTVDNSQSFGFIKQ